jgi:hypothetical protein
MPIRSTLYLHIAAALYAALYDVTPTSRWQPISTLGGARHRCEKIANNFLLVDRSRAMCGELRSRRDHPPRSDPE